MSISVLPGTRCINDRSNSQLELRIAKAIRNSSCELRWQFATRVANRGNRLENPEIAVLHWSSRKFIKVNQKHTNKTLIETEGSDLSRKVREVVPVHLALCRTNPRAGGRVMAKTVLQNANFTTVVLYPHPFFPPPSISFTLPPSPPRLSLFHPPLFPSPFSPRTNPAHKPHLCTT